MSLNRACILGFLGANPEARTTSGGQRVTTLRVATGSKWAGKNGEQHESTEWHRVVLWGRLAEFAELYLKKGKQVYIEGRLQTREWTDGGHERFTTEIIANNLQLVGTRDSEASSEAASGETGLAPEVEEALKKF